jgi:hypothetical protein
VRAIPSKPLTIRTTVAAFVAVSAVGLTACSGTAGTEEGTDVADVVEEDVAADGAVADPFDGPYDTDFRDGVDSYAGQEVVLSADVNEVITPESFTIAGTDDTTVEALLVVGATGDAELAPETTVEVTGTVQQAFVLADVEEELGIDLDDALFDDYEQEPYVVAEDVEVLEQVD